MALSIDREELDEFCPRLFRTLDRLGLLPLWLRAKPNEFEKYPRLLFGGIQRYNDVEAGFREWESRVLRDVPYRKEEYYPDLDALRQWMVRNKDVFAKRANMQHLRTSLYARLFHYVYPLRVLANAYCVKHHGNSDAIGPEFVRMELPRSIEADIRNLKDAYEVQWETVVSDARDSIIANDGYYRKVIQGKQLFNSPEEAEAEIVEEVSS